MSVNGMMGGSQRRWCGGRFGGGMGRLMLLACELFTRGAGNTLT